jgi:hypothetical protein
MAIKKVKFGRKPLYDNEINNMRPGDKRTFGLDEYYRARSFHQRIKQLGKSSTFDKTDMGIEVVLQ